jgi:hypothetical protein
MILSITDGVPEKLICGTCRSVHKFRAERPAPAPRPARATGATRSAAPRSTAVSPSRFQELMLEEHASTTASPYVASRRWEEGQWMDHPRFGLGRIQKRAGRKVDVLFQDGLKTLISA